MDKEISEYAEKAIREKVFPGCVIGIVRTNGEREIDAFGTTIYGSGGDKVKKDTVYDVASITKSIPTASLALAMIQEGTISLSDTVKTYIPELENDRNARVEDLLRYRVRGTRLSTLQYRTFEEIRTHVFERGLEGLSDTPVYTNLSAFLLGMIVERKSGTSLAAQAHKTFFEPFGMHDTTFFPSHEACVPTEIDERGIVQGVPHDESAYLFAKARRTVGHAGLFSTAPDLLNFLEALFTEKLSYIAEYAEQGLGWQLSDQGFMGQHASARTFGKTGFTGTSVVCDRERGIVLVILSNRTYPKRSLDTNAINSFRCKIADLLF